MTALLKLSFFVSVLSLFWMIFLGNIEWLKYAAISHLFLLLYNIIYTIDLLERTEVDDCDIEGCAVFNFLSPIISVAFGIIFNIITWSTTT